MDGPSCSEQPHCSPGARLAQDAAGRAVPAGAAPGAAAPSAGTGTASSSLPSRRLPYQKRH